MYRLLQYQIMLGPADHAAGHEYRRALAYNLAATLASVPAGRLADRRGPVGVLAAGVALFLAAYLGLALTGASLVVLAGCFVAAGVAIGWVETAEHAAVATAAPEGCAARRSGCWPPSRASGTWPPAVWPGCCGPWYRRGWRSATWPAGWRWR
jgi:MFS family permease